MIGPFVSADWLTSNLSNVAIADTRWYLDGRDGHKAYLAGHIPGARFIDLDTVLAGPPAPIAGRHPLPPPELFAKGMGAAGFRPDDTVIAYDDLGGMVAGRLVWSLRILGRSAAVLDGGLAAWQGVLDSGEVADDATDYEATPWPAEAIATAEDVTELLDNNGVVVDARAPERFRGEVEPVDPRPGHIPGAVNLSFTSLLNGDGTLRADATDQVAAVGLGGDAIAYCGSGVSACVDVLVAEQAGLGRPRLYVGSWSGWSSDPDLPSATGSSS